MKDITTYSGRVYAYKDIGQNKAFNELAIPNYIHFNRKTFRLDFPRYEQSVFEASTGNEVDTFTKPIRIKDQLSVLKAENFWTNFEKEALELVVVRMIPSTITNTGVKNKFIAGYEVRRFSLHHVEEAVSIAIKNKENEVTEHFSATGAEFRQAMIDYPKLLSYFNAAWKIGRNADKDLKNYKK